MIDAASPCASITESTYRVLREQILSGVIEPGAKLKIGELCARLSVNLSAMREALTRLGAEGIVVAEPQRGFRAAPISTQDLEDLTRVRIDIETLCLHRSMDNEDVAWEARVVAASHTLSRTPRGAHPSEVNPAWPPAHIAFHAALCSGCDSPWLLRLRDQLSTQNERYRRLALSTNYGRRSPNGEHLALAEAVLARDKPKTAALIRDHFWVTTRNFLVSLSDAPYVQLDSPRRGELRKRATS